MRGTAESIHFLVDWMTTSDSEWVSLEVIKIGSLVLYTVFGVLVAVLIAASSTDSSIEYNAMTAVLFMEMLKFTIAVLFWDKDSGLSSFSFRSYLTYSIPALCYAASNSMNIYALASLNPVVFHVLSSLKILFTALFSWMILNQRLTSIQYIAMLLLVIAMIAMRLNSSSDKSSSFYGLVLVFITSILSGFSGIYTEKILKSREESSFMFKSIQLYSWGVILSFLSILLTPRFNFSSPFSGFNIFILAWIFSCAAQGLSIAIIMRYLSTIHKCFASILVLLLNVGISYAFFGVELDSGMILGVILYSIALYLYFGSHNSKLLSPRQLGSNDDSFSFDVSEGQEELKAIFKSDD